MCAWQMWLTFVLMRLLCLAEFCNNLLAKLGDRWAAPLALLRTWTYSAFYLVAEMWGSVGEHVHEHAQKMGRAASV